MTQFGRALKAQLEATSDLRRRGKRILAILNGPSSARKTRFLKRAERHAIAVSGEEFSDEFGIDWDNFDWSKFLEQILAILLKLLPLLFI